MAHELDGNWDLKIVTSRDEIITVKPDGKFELEHDAANQLKATSKHGSHELKGSSLPDGSEFQIGIFEKFTLVGGRVKYLPYFGNLIAKKTVSGTTFRVIGGFVLPMVDQLPSLEETAEMAMRALVTGQNDGVWIGTQP